MTALYCAQNYESILKAYGPIMIDAKDVIYDTGVQMYHYVVY